MVWCGVVWRVCEVHVMWYDVHVMWYDVHVIWYDVI
jgi:hypothetical protein